MKRISYVLLILTATVIITACEKDSVDSKVDYFPTSHKAKWSYFNSLISYSWSEDTVYIDGTSTYQIEKDTIVEGKKYALLTASIAGYPKRGIRKESNNYYYLDFNYSNRQREYIFLKDNLPVGSSWEELSLDGLNKHVYTIKAKAQEKIIKGKVYREVIDVEERRLYKEESSFYTRHVIQHSYAKNVGEIYAYYPASSLSYVDLILELLEYTE